MYDLSCNKFYYLFKHNFGKQKLFIIYCFYIINNFYVENNNNSNDNNWNIITVIVINIKPREFSHN